jgi:hypothetical protein
MQLRDIPLYVCMDKGLGIQQEKAFVSVCVETTTD